MKKNILLVFVLLLTPFFTACKDKSAMIEKENGLKIEITKEGDGAEAKDGSNVVVHYTGTFENGETFDSSHDRGEPFKFTLGIGRVIKGWDEGLLGMKVGGKRNLTVPPALGYGENGIKRKMPDGEIKEFIPENATLFFDVELLEIR
jgi:peptidylprolyl isomerase